MEAHKLAIAAALAFLLSVSGAQAYDYGPVGDFAIGYLVGRIIRQVIIQPPQSQPNYNNTQRTQPYQACPHGGRLYTDGVCR